MGESSRLSQMFLKSSSDDESGSYFPLSNLAPFHSQIFLVCQLRSCIYLVFILALSDSLEVPQDSCLLMAQRKIQNFFISIGNYVTIFRIWCQTYIIHSLLPLPPDKPNETFHCCDRWSQFLQKFYVLNRQQPHFQCIPALLWL